jgi:hypothetical protein
MGYIPRTALRFPVVAKSGDHSSSISVIMAIELPFLNARLPVEQLCCGHESQETDDR